MKALISPNEDNILYVASWNAVYDTDGTTIIDYDPVWDQVGDAARIVEFAEDANVFEVAPPLFWTDCDSSIDTLTHYWNKVSNSIQPIPNVEKPSI
tara:strand:+ start:2133 stop:2420 length:288 start_codon:yes stop_codon:yes gene_type:complete